MDLVLKAQTAGVSTAVLDTRALLIKGVSSGSTELKVCSVCHSLTVVSSQLVQYVLEKEHEAFGSALRIDLGKSLAADESITVRVSYETTPASSAIQWLNPSQTAGKVHPYMFTQCQAIHCRSLIPCQVGSSFVYVCVFTLHASVQDTPSVKAPYTATIRAPAPLVALMSALSTGSTADGAHTVYTFEQTVPVPVRPFGRAA